MEMKEISKGYFQMAGRFLVSIGLTLAFVITAFPMDLAQAKGRSLPAYYPPSYDGTGQVDAIKTRDVVIDDRLMKLGVGVRYYTPRTKWAKPANFPRGTPVGYMKNSAGEITGLWLLVPPGPRGDE